MNKQKILSYIEDLEDKAKQSDKYFIERNEVYAENKQLKDRIEKGIEYIKERTEFNQYSEVYPSVLDAREVKRLLEILKGE